AKVSLLNSGAITATATAIAKGAVSDHSGYMRAYGVDQSVSNVVTAAAAISNSGTIAIHAKFDNVNSGDSEFLSVAAEGIGQSIAAEQSAVASLANSAQIAVGIDAAFTAGGSQSNDAVYAYGLAQTVRSGQAAASLTNTGALSLTGNVKIDAGA